VAAQLRTLLKHADHRVRVEAVRALVLVAVDAPDVLIGALSDQHERVRQSALSLLRSQQLAGSETRIVEAINGDAVGAAEKLGLVDVLAGIGTAGSRASLEDLAGRRVMLRPAQRAIRDAARGALEKGSG
jgi:HEAT repeat protein